MSLGRRVAVCAALWIAFIGGLHGWLNLDLFRPRGEAGKPFRVGFLPVT
jgi:hypothetical protein